jgi:hypothetical protein
VNCRKQGQPHLNGSVANTGILGVVGCAVLLGKAEPGVEADWCKKRCQRSQQHC